MWPFRKTEPPAFIKTRHVRTFCFRIVGVNRLQQFWVEVKDDRCSYFGFDGLDPDQAPGEWRDVDRVRYGTVT